MVPHSLDKLWRSHGFLDRVQPRPKKAGAPALQWTPAREEALYRLIAKGNVPMKDIAIAMREPAVPAGPDGPGQPEFAPCKSSCRTHWHKMTDLKPRQVLISNMFGSQKKHKKRMIAAFKAHQERQPTLNLPIESQTHSVVQETHGLQREDATPTRSIQAGEAADTSTPLLTFEGDTPADLGAVFTPEPHEIIPPLNARNDKQRLMGAPAITSIADMAQHPTKGTSTKRPAPSGFDEISDSEKITKRHSAAGAAQKLFPTTPIQGGSARTDVLDDLEPVPEEPVSPGRTVDEVEKDMDVPHGFIHWLKNDLARSRRSVQSVISAISIAASRISSRRSSQQPSVRFTMSGELGSLFNSQTSRQDYQLFAKLRLPDVTDNEVAEQVRQLLQEYSPDEARYIVRARNERQETALEVALALGNVPACEVLLHFGADVNATTSNGKSLSAFGREAERTATTPQQIIAIGTCRNRIRSHTGHGDTRPNSEARKPKLKSSVSTSASQRARSRAQITTSYPQKGHASSNVLPTQSSHPAGPAIGVNHDQPHQYARPVVSQNSNGRYSQLASSQPAPAPVFSDPWIPEHQSVHVSHMTNNNQGYLSNTQLSNSEVVAEGGTIVPAPSAFDPRTGYWTRVGGNRRAFILHDHIDILPGTLAPPASDPSTGYWTRVGGNLRAFVLHDHIDILPITQAPILSHGPSQFPAPEAPAVPTAPSNFEQLSQLQSRRDDGRRYGMFVVPSALVPNTFITPTDPVSRRLQQLDAIASTTPAFSNLYGTPNYNSQTNILWDAQLAFQAAFQQGLSNDNAALGSVLEAQFDTSFSQESLSNTHIPLMWDGIWR